MLNLYDHQRDINMKALWKIKANFQGDIEKAY